MPPNSMTPEEISKRMSKKQERSKRNIKERSKNNADLDEEEHDEEIIELKSCFPELEFPVSFYCLSLGRPEKYNYSLIDMKYDWELAESRHC